MKTAQRNSAREQKDQTYFSHDFLHDFFVLFFGDVMLSKCGFQRFFGDGGDFTLTLFALLSLQEVK